MTTSRLAFLAAFVVLGFAAVFLLPRSYDQPSGIRMELPDFVANWKGTEAEITQKERDALGEASGTRISRKTYRNLDGYEITVSIVLSGRDMSTSIHRPERCLQAQGWTVIDSEDLAMSLTQRGVFPVKQLRTSRSGKNGDELITQEGNVFYWFVGEREITADHLGRWTIDNRDRLFRGMNQRWAFILLSAGVPVPRDPKDTEAARKWSQNAIREFIRTLAPKIHLESVRYL